jgi:hypothetical protein
MSFLNSGIDVTNFMGDSFDTGMAVNARNKANAYLKGGAAKRAGDLAGQGSSLFGKFKGQSLLADAGAYAQQQQANASMFGNIANLAGGIGGFAAMGGFSGNPIKTLSDGTAAKAWNTDLNIGGFTPSEIFRDQTIDFGSYLGN